MSIRPVREQIYGYIDDNYIEGASDDLYNLLNRIEHLELIATAAHQWSVDVKDESFHQFLKDFVTEYYKKYLPG